MNAESIAKQIVKDFNALSTARGGFWEDEDLERLIVKALASERQILTGLLEHLDSAESRFTAMAMSTIENGVPTAHELIAMCNVSAAKLGMGFTSIKDKINE